ncbi:MAG: hypothetical protein U1E65_22295 [Myxococcota bacterium]
MRRSAPQLWPELLAASVFLGWWIYSALAALSQTWTGDVHLYLAGLAELERAPWHPRHEAMDVPGSQSALYTPYLVGLSILARIGGLSPLGALRVGAVFNLALYAVSALWFFRHFSRHRSSVVPAAAFLIASGLLRDRMFIWSSDTSVASLRFVAAYPSTFAFGLAMLILGLARALLEGWEGWGRPVALAGLLALVYLSHALTGSFVLVALAAMSLVSEGPRRGRISLGLAAIAGLILALAWPYYDVLGHRAYLRVAEGAPFVGKEVSSFYRAALLAILALVASPDRGRYVSLVAAWGATLTALVMLEALGVSYAARFAFFGAFFLFVLAAEGVADAVTTWRRAPLWSASYLAIFAILALTTPGLRDQQRHGRPMLAAWELWSAPPPESPISQQAEQIAGLLLPGDRIMMPVDHLSFDLASLSGARVVLSPFADRVEDAVERRADVDRFFDEATPSDERRRILERWRVSVIVAPKSAVLGMIGGAGTEVGGYRVSRL